MSKANTLSVMEFFGWKRHPFVDLPVTIGIDGLSIKRDLEIARRVREFIKATRSITIIGTPGTGKTTLVKTIAQSLDPRHWRPIWLSYAGCNRSGVLRILAEKIGLELTRKGLPPLHKLLRHMAQLQKEPGSQFPVIIVDDAQYLETESLMDLCAILAHPDDQGTLASLILLGDESLDRILRMDCRRAIASRMACIFRMEPLNPDEAKGLLERRLEIAKAPKNLFADDAIELLAAQCRGNRRELLNLATKLCIEAHQRGEKTVSAELVMTTTPMQTIG